VQYGNYLQIPQTPDNTAFAGLFFCTFRRDSAAFTGIFRAAYFFGKIGLCPYLGTLYRFVPFTAQCQIDIFIAKGG
jgi:hypothetical protein